MGMGNVGFGAGSASSEPVLALFPRLAADPALMMVRAQLLNAKHRASLHDVETEACRHLFKYPYLSRKNVP